MKIDKRRLDKALRSAGPPTVRSVKVWICAHIFVMILVAVAIYILMSVLSMSMDPYGMGSPHPLIMVISMVWGAQLIALYIIRNEYKKTKNLEDWEIHISNWECPHAIAIFNKTIKCNWPNIGLKSRRSRRGKLPDCAKETCPARLINNREEKLKDMDKYLDLTAGNGPKKFG